MRSTSGVEIRPGRAGRAEGRRMSLRAFVAPETSVAISSSTLPTSNPAMKEPID